MSTSIDIILKACTSCLPCLKDEKPESDDDVIDIKTTLVCCVYTNSLTIDNVDSCKKSSNELNVTTNEEEEEEGEKCQSTSKEEEEDSSI